MKKIFLSLMLFSFFSFVLFSCANKEKEAVLSQKYIDSLKRELNIYSNRIKNNPNNVYAYIDRAKVEEILGKQQAALEDYKKAISIEPLNYNLYQYKAKVEKTLGNFAEALEDLDKVVELTPKNSRAYIDRSNLKSSIGDYSGAIEDVNKAIELNNNNDDYYYYVRATIKGKLGDRKGAIEDYTKAIELNPVNVVAYKCKAEMIDIRDNYEEAIELFKKITELTPNETILIPRSSLHFFVRTSLRASDISVV